MFSRIRTLRTQSQVVFFFNIENWKDGLEYKFWNQHYTVEKIARWIFIACNEEPRKIPYDLLISFFEKNTPINDVYLFYSDVFQMVNY